MPVKTQEVSTTNLSVIYDRIYDIADRLFKKYNPCDIHIEDGKIRCICRRYTKRWPKSLCCGACNHWSKIGCTVKCLPCKLFVCSALVYDFDKNGRETRNKKYKSFVDRLYKLRDIADRYGISTHAYYNTKSKVLMGGQL